MIWLPTISPATISSYEFPLNALHLLPTSGTSGMMFLQSRKLFLPKLHCTPN